MTIDGMLVTLSNTINKITVTGKDDCERILGCLSAIETIRSAVYELTHPVENKDKGEGEDGRQSDK